jgi:diguanylate cyclase (GGDEF)-like protein
MAVLNNHAYSELWAGEYERAQAIADRLQRMAVAYGVELDPADFDTIGSIQIENGLFAEAERTLQHCIAVHHEGHHETADSLAVSLLALARAQRGLGATDRAQVTLAASEALCIERDLADLHVRVRREQAELCAARGEYELAYEELKRVFAAQEALRSAQREAQARTRQAMFETAEARDEAARFREQARRDPLTGLRNRRYIDEQLPGLLADPAGVVTIAVLDLDHFKRVNDTLSHEVGDEVLVAVAGILEAAVAAARPAGIVARIGGEEFLIVMPGVDRVDGVRQLEGIRKAVRSHRWAGLTGDLAITVSIGAASGHGGEASREELLAVADRNLYDAKRGGRDRVVAGPENPLARRTFRDA